MSFLDVSAPDEFGVPSNMFGPIDDMFAHALTRVVMTSALLEMRTDALLQALDHRPQPTWAGEGLGRALSRIGVLLSRGVPARPTLDDGLRDEIREVCDRVEELGRKRNDLVHGVWPVASLRAGIVWRFLPGSQRAEEPGWTKTFQTNEALFRQTIRDLCEAINEVDLIRQRVEAVPRLHLDWVTDEAGKIKRAF